MDRLVVCFEVGGERYGIPAVRVVEVVPAVPLRDVPGTHDGVVGVLRHRGGVVPVVDPSVAWGKGPLPRRLSTRILLCELEPVEGRVATRLGILGERVTRVANLDPDSPVGDLPATPGARGLGTLVRDGDGLLHLVEVDQLVSREILDSLVRTEAAAT